MAVYDHVCTNTECNHEWEDSYSIKADPPKVCPICHQETAKRLISLNGKGVVELTGRDLKDKVMADAKKLQVDAAKSDKLYSNLLGESRYQQMQGKMDKQKRGW